MTSHGYVCRSCRFKLQIPSRSRVNGPNPCRKLYSTSSTAPPVPTETESNGQDASQSTVKRRFLEVPTRQKRPGVSFRPPRHAKARASDHDSSTSLMDWVQTNYNDYPGQGKDKGTAATKHVGLSKNSGAGPVTTLEKMLVPQNSNGLNAQEAWKFFLTEFYPGCPALVSPSLTDVPKIKRTTSNVFMQLYEAMVKEWTQGRTTDIPSPSACVARFREVGVMRSEFYAQAILPLEIDLLSQDVGSIEPSNRMLQEILLIWQMFFDAHAHALAREHPRKHTSSVDWSCLPAPTAVQKMLMLKDRRIGGDDFQLRKLPHRLVQVVAGFPTHAADELEVALLLTFHLLVLNHTPGSIHADDAVNTEIEPFLNFVSHLLHHADTFRGQERVIQYLDRLVTKPSAAQKQLMENLKKTKSYASIAFGGSSEWTSLLKSTKEKDQPWRSLADFFVGSFYGAQEHKSLRLAKNTWTLVQDAYTTRVGDTTKVNIPSTVYDVALTTFMALRRQDLAIEVWQFLRKNGVRPTVASWTAMIVGCRLAKRGDAIAEVWQRMHRAGIEPDTRAYTEAIFGFLWCEYYEQGYRLLDEMSEKWTRAAEATYGKPIDRLDVKTIRSLPGAPKPNASTLNTVITALSRGKARRYQEVSKVFAWAEALGIEPTIDTYNVMLQMHLEQHDMQSAMNVLRRMQENSIQPNVITFSMLSNVIFGREGTIDLEPDKQLAFILRFLWEVESRGMTPNSHMYGTIIDGIIHRNTDTTVAQGVLTHMRAKGLKPSVHICTMLMTHHFSKDPPDLEAINALWRTMLSDNVAVDGFFYDRMIEGYSRIGEVGKMMTFLTRMSKDGLQPSWKALTAVVEALLGAGDRQRAMEVVADVRKTRAVDADSSRQSHGMQDFWQLVAEERLATGL